MSHIQTSTRVLTLTSGGACIAINESKPPSSASKPEASPGATKSFDPHAFEINSI